jgi:hypothetical protein
MLGFRERRRSRVDDSDWERMKRFVREDKWVTRGAWLAFVGLLLGACVKGIQGNWLTAALAALLAVACYFVARWEPPVARIDWDDRD